MLFLFSSLGIGSSLNQIPFPCNSEQEAFRIFLQQISMMLHVKKRFLNLAILFVLFSIGFSRHAVAQTYCFPGFQMACFYGDQITRVVFAGINHFDNVCTNDADGKKDFTTTVTPAEVIAGSTYTLTVTFTVNSSVGAIAWLDFNDDGVFRQ